jgi:hypothetical protein
MPDRSESGGGCAAGMILAGSKRSAHPSSNQDLHMALRSTTVYESAVLLACHENQKKGHFSPLLVQQLRCREGKMIPRGQDEACLYP